MTRAGLLPSPGVVSDAAGRFDFGPQPAAVFVATARGPRLTGALARIDLRAPSSTQRSTARSATPRAAWCPEYGWRSRRGATAETAVDGSYELCVPPGGADLLVEADGYAALTARLAATGRTRRDFELVPSATVSGRVVGADNRSAIEGGEGGRAERAGRARGHRGRRRRREARGDKPLIVPLTLEAR